MLCKYGCRKSLTITKKIVGFSDRSSVAHLTSSFFIIIKHIGVKKREIHQSLIRGFALPKPQTIILYYIAIVQSWDKVARAHVRPLRNIEDILLTSYIS